MTHMNVYVALGFVAACVVAINMLDQSLRGDRLLARGALWFVGVCWVILVCLVAWLDAVAPVATHPSLAHGVDVVTFEENSDSKSNAELRGRVVRLIERGVILRGQSDGRLMFIPKDRIRRIDQGVPAGG